MLVSRILSVIFGVATFFYVVLKYSPFEETMDSIHGFLGGPVPNPVIWVGCAFAIAGLVDLGWWYHRHATAKAIADAFAKAKAKAKAKAELQARQQPKMGKLVDPAKKKSDDAL